MDTKSALLTILDQVDYTNGACRSTEMVGAVLPKEVIALARDAIAEFDRQVAVGVGIANRVYLEQEAKEDMVVRKYSWEHPLLFGASQWVKKSDVEPFIHAAKKLFACFFELGEWNDETPAFEKAKDEIEIDKCLGELGEVLKRFE